MRERFMIVDSGWREYEITLYENVSFSEIKLLRKIGINSDNIEEGARTIASLWAEFGSPKVLVETSGCGRLMCSALALLVPRMFEQ